MRSERIEENPKIPKPKKMNARLELLQERMVIYTLNFIVPNSLVFICISITCKHLGFFVSSS